MFPRRPGTRQSVSATRCREGGGDLAAVIGLQQQDGRAIAGNGRQAVVAGGEDDTDPFIFRSGMDGKLGT